MVGMFSRQNIVNLYLCLQSYKLQLRWGVPCQQIKKSTTSDKWWGEQTCPRKKCCSSSFRSISESLWNQGQGEADTEVSCEMCPWKGNSAKDYIWESMVCVQVFWESSLASSTLHRKEPQLPLSECRDFIGTAQRYIYRPALHFNAKELFH